MSTSFTRGENPLRADKLNQALSERVSRAGDTMTGPLKVPATPTSALDAVPKQYVDGIASGSIPSGVYLPLSGGTVTGRTDFTGGFTSAYPGTPNKFYSTPTHPSAAYINQTNQLFSYFVAAAVGGTIGDVVTNARFYSSITGAPDTYIFNALNVVDYAGSGGHGQQVASYNQALRRTVNAGGSTHNPEIFGGVFEVIDFTGVDSNQTNTMNGIEVDMTCGGPDSANSRRGFGMYVNTVGGAVSNAVVNTGVHIAANVGSYNTMINLQSTFNTAAVDMRTANAATGAAHQIWLGTAGTIALDTNASIILSGDAGGAMIMTGMLGSPARIIFEPAGGTTRQWWAGAWNDNNFYIGDATGAVTRLTITPAGLFTFNGPVEVNGVTIHSFASNPAFALSFATLPTNAANDAAAAGAGVPVGGVYRNGSVLMVRVA